MTSIPSAGATPLPSEKALSAEEQFQLRLNKLNALNALFAELTAMTPLPSDKKALSAQELAQLRLNEFNAWCAERKQYGQARNRSFYLKRSMPESPSGNAPPAQPPTDPQPAPPTRQQGVARAMVNTVLPTCESIPLISAEDVLQSSQAVHLDLLLSRAVCCAVCARAQPLNECTLTRAHDFFKTLVGRKIHKRCGIPQRVREEHADVIPHYDVSPLLNDPKFRDVMLAPQGVFTVTSSADEDFLRENLGDSQFNMNFAKPPSYPRQGLVVCGACSLELLTGRSEDGIKNDNLPPKYSIANGHYYGFFTEDPTQPESNLLIDACAPNSSSLRSLSARCVSSCNPSVVATNPATQRVFIQEFFVAATTPCVGETGFAALAARGTLPSAQDMVTISYDNKTSESRAAQIKSRMLASVGQYRKIIRFLVQHNYLYKLEDACTDPEVFVDQVLNALDPDNPVHRDSDLLGTAHQLPAELDLSPLLVQTVSTDNTAADGVASAENLDPDLPVHSVYFHVALGEGESDLSEEALLNQFGEKIRELAVYQAAMRRSFSSSAAKPSTTAPPPSQPSSAPPQRAPTSVNVDASSGGSANTYNMAVRLGTDYRPRKAMQRDGIATSHPEASPFGVGLDEPCATPITAEERLRRLACEAHRNRGQNKSLLADIFSELNHIRMATSSTFSVFRDKRAEELVYMDNKQLLNLVSRGLSKDKQESAPANGKFLEWAMHRVLQTQYGTDESQWRRAVSCSR